MRYTDILGFIAEEEEAQRHEDALESLLRILYKLLHEPLEERIRRAQNNGEWLHLSQEESAALHEGEKLHFKLQVDELRHEQHRTRGKLDALRRTKARAKRIRAAQVASERKRRGTVL